MFLSKKIVAGLVAALAIVAGSAAFAAVPDAAGVIHGCYDKGSGQVRITDSDTNVPKACTTKEKAVNWNQQGAKGETGAAGGASDGYITTKSTAAGDEVTSLSLPPGSYIISAKLEVVSFIPSEPFTCLLGAGVNLENSDYDSGITGPGDPFEDVTLVIAHTFNYGAAAVLKCQGDVQLKNVVLTAVTVGELHRS